VVVLSVGVKLVLDGGESAEEQVARVSHDGGATRRDASLGLMKQEAGKEVVDGSGGLEVREPFSEEGGEIGSPAEVVSRMGVLGTEGGRGVSNEHAAAAVAGALLTAGQILRPQGLRYRIGFVDNVGVSGLQFHFGPQFWEVTGYDTRQFCVTRLFPSQKQGRGVAYAAEAAPASAGKATSSEEGCDNRHRFSL